MRTVVLLIVGPPFSYATRLRMRSVDVAGHYSLLARPFDNVRFVMPQSVKLHYLTGNAPMTDNNVCYQVN